MVRLGFRLSAKLVCLRRNFGGDLMKPSSILPELVETVLIKLENKYRNFGQSFFSDEDLLELNSLFGPVFERALETLDSVKIIVYKSPNRLCELIEIQGHSNHVYKLFPYVNYCPCQSFKHQVLHHRTQYTCKHVLAARIAQIFNKVEERVLTDDQFNFLMKNVNG